LAAPSYKMLGQECPTGTGVTNLIDVPTGHQYIAATIVVNNITGALAHASIHIRPLGAGLADKHKFWTSVPVLPGHPEHLTLGVGLAATDVVDVQSDTGSALAFHAIGVDLS
jgi:hypothetical protein